MALCLVTGGAGFIGSHLVGRLLESQHAVRVLDNFSTGKADNLARVRDRIELVQGSVTDPEAVQVAVKGADWIAHLAALPSVQRSVEDPLSSHEVCATGTLNVLNAAAPGRGPAGRLCRQQQRLRRHAGLRADRG